MTENYVIQYTFPIAEAALLASLGGIQTDLRGVVDYVEFLEANEELTKFNFVVWEAICAAAVVRYARCFGSGVRKSVPAEVLAAAPENLQDDHKFFVEVRSKHVAHSVNDFEENTVVVQVGGAKGDDPEIQSINTQHSRVIGLAFNEPQRLKALSQWMLLRVAELVERERERLLPIATEFGLAKIKSFGTPELGRGGDRGTVRTRRMRP